MIELWNQTGEKSSFVSGKVYCEKKLLEKNNEVFT